MAELRRGFEPPPEVTSYFEGKALTPRFSWLDVWGEEHAHAFTVAKATELELLTSFRDSIAGAIRKGQGFENWKVEMRAELVRLGWAKPRLVSDPAGIDPDRMVDFMSGRRLKTIFSSNVNSARSAGQWERAQRTKRTLPFILYVRTTSADPRQEHLSWVGIILPIDDPFWRTHWPPNGWSCKCQVRQITAREAERLLGRDPADGGIIYKTTPPDLGPDIPHRNRRTGEVTMIPPGIDPGWHTNPGLSRARTLMRRMEDQVKRAAPQEAREAIADFWSSPSPKAYATIPDIQMPVAHAPRIARKLDAIGDLVSVSSGTVAAKLDKHAPVEPSSFGKVQELLDDGEEIARPDGSLTFWKQIDGHWWVAALRKSGTGFLRIATLFRASERRRDEVRRKSGEAAGGP